MRTNLREDLSEYLAWKTFREVITVTWSRVTRFRTVSRIFRILPRTIQILRPRANMLEELHSENESAQYALPQSERECIEELGLTVGADAGISLPP